MMTHASQTVSRASLSADLDSRACMDEVSLQLVNRYRDGDDEAAEELFARYVSRLVGLARTRISPSLKRRMDAEDVIQSVYRTFFVHAKENRYVLERSGDLWRLLVGITMNKLHRQIEFHTAGKRNFRREDSICLSRNRDLVSIPVEAVAQGPSPADAAAIVEELDALLEQLESPHREILELRMQGKSVEEIAVAVARSERTVRRTLERVRNTLERQLLSNLEK